MISFGAEIVTVSISMLVLVRMVLIQLVLVLALVLVLVLGCFGDACRYWFGTGSERW